ncbi:MAG: hypothetical protein QXT99_09865 [Candidatus Nitrosotenuis sp.]
MIKADAKANVTDPDSRIMKRGSGYVARIQWTGSGNRRPDNHCSGTHDRRKRCEATNPHDKKAEGNIATLELNDKGIGVVLADAGYCSDRNTEDIKPDSPECSTVATKKDWKQREALRETEPPRGRIPKSLLLRERVERKLLMNFSFTVSMIYVSIRR